jgi:two-component system chemotaxis response regulator CheB/chemosensory pili system protein ChpB (putative protein-glutamate methylesterase)
VNVSDPLPGVAVALVYETRERSDHVRETLAAIGTSIVYESAAHALDRAALEQSRASVVVVNLDAQDEDDLENVYSLLDDDRYRVVFNDGEVSIGLSGWDHARWVRHLATKILQGADIDPPRPADAQAIPARVAATPAPTGDATAATAALSGDHVKSVEPTPDTAIQATDFAELPQAPAMDRASTLDGHAGLDTPLDASVAPSSVFDVFDINDFGGLDLDFEAAPTPPPPVAVASVAGEPEADEFALDALDFSVGVEDSAVDKTVASRTDAGGDLLDFGLDQTIDFDAPLPAALSQTVPATAPAPIAVPAVDEHDALEWSLEDIIDEPSATPPVPVAAHPMDFGIEKLRAEEFLAPVAAPESASTLGPLSGLSLELMPLEEAVAPSAIEAVAHENWFDPNATRVPKAKIRRVWVLGASIGGPEAVREFLADLPRDYPALFILAQHLGEEFVDMMARQLGQATTLPVRVPSHGERAGHGEVLIAPNSQRLLVDAQGVVVLERDATPTAFNPSIDRILRDVADRFGADAGAIVFSGMSTDALEGCRHVVAKGGTVYAQRQDTCVVSTMIDGIAEAALVSFFGSPRELAQKLVADSA